MARRKPIDNVATLSSNVRLVSDKRLESFAKGITRLQSEENKILEKIKHIQVSYAEISGTSSLELAKKYHLEYKELKLQGILNSKRAKLSRRMDTYSRNTEKNRDIMRHRIAANS